MSYISFHQMGGAAMGAEASRAVIDRTGAVYGLQGVYELQSHHDGIVALDGADVLPPASILAALAADGLHPATEQYRQWVDLILPVAAALVGASSGSVPA